MSTPEVLLACARPQDVPAGDWAELEEMLDDDELHRARRLRFDVDVDDRWRDTPHRKRDRARVAVEHVGVRGFRFQ